MTEYIRTWVKYSLFFTSFLSWLASAAMVIIGSVIIYEKKEYMSKLLDVVIDPAIAFIVVGGLVMVISFIGTVGALRENMVFLNIFVNSLMIMVVVQMMLAVCVLFFYTVPDARFNIRYLNPETYFKQYIITYMTSDDVTDLVDSFQEEYQCCGYSNNEMGYKDWEENIYFNCLMNNTAAQRCSVPHSCCRSDEVKKEKIEEVNTGWRNTGCGQNVRKLSNPVEIDSRIFRRGCMKAFHQWLEKNLAVASSTLFCVIIPQVATMFLAMSLDEDIAKQKAQWNLKSGNSTDSMRRHKRKRTTRRRKYEHQEPEDHDQKHMYGEYMQAMKQYAAPMMQDADFAPMHPSQMGQPLAMVHGYHPGPASPHNEWYVHNTAGF